MAGDINRVTLVGRLTRDPELRHLPSGSPVLQLGLAVNGRQKDDAELDRQAQLLRRQGLREPGGDALAAPAKGRRVGIDGRLDWSSWEAQDGSKRSPRSRSWPSRCSSWIAAPTAASRASTSRPPTLRPTARLRAAPAPPRRTTTFRSRERGSKADGTRAGQAPPHVSLDGPDPAEELLLLPGEDRRGRLQELQPAAALHLREGQDPLAADHGRLPPPSGPDRGRCQAGARGRAPALRRVAPRERRR